MDRDWVLHDLLGHGRPRDDGRFSVRFQRRAFQLDWFDFGSVPRPWVRVSVERGSPRYWCPVLDHRAEWPSDALELDLGALELPKDCLEPDFVSPGVVVSPGRWRSRRRYEASDEDLQAALREVLPVVRRATGCSQLHGPVEWVDELGPKLPWPLGATFTSAGRYSPEDDRILLSRRVIERQGHDALRVTLGHELVHRAQARRHPGVFASIEELKARDDSTTLQAFLTNVEGHARYVENEYLRAHWPLAQPTATASLGALLLGMVAMWTATGLNEALDAVSRRYEEGEAVYRHLHRVRADRGCAVPFRPDLWTRFLDRGPTRSGRPADRSHHRV